MPGIRDKKMLNFYFKNLKIIIKRLLKRPISMDELIFAYLKPGYTVLEAGAHNGTDTKRLAALTKNKVFAFEPVPHLFAQLKSQTQNIKNVSIFNKALGDSDQKLQMFVSDGQSDASSSLLRPARHLEKNPEVTFNNVIEVDMITLDSWALENNVENIDFMWLDMQGYEYNMLKASKTMFARLKVLYTEVSTIELYESQVLYSAYKEWLIESGFKLIKEDLHWGFTGNALFVRA